MNARPRPERNPDLTRQRILEAAYHAMHRHGYQGMRLDEVIASTGLTKGALYHHFPNKRALGYAVVEEIVRGMIDQLWLEPLAQADDPLATLSDFISGLPQQLGAELVTLGCPLNNLAQEMSPLDEGFRARIDAILTAWHQGLSAALHRGQARGRVRADLDCERAASFIIGAVEGCIGMAKNAQDPDRLASCGAGLVDYLESLRS